MSTIEYPEPNTTVAKLTLSLENCLGDLAVVEDIKELIEEDTRMPTGATIQKGTGIWMPRTDDGKINHEKKEVEKNVTIEFWIDSVEELNRIREFKNVLETRYNQECVCLSLEDRYYEH